MYLLLFAANQTLADLGATDEQKIADCDSGVDKIKE